jgi:hypothetical protein
VKAAEDKVLEACGREAMAELRTGSLHAVSFDDPLMTAIQLNEKWITEVMMIEPHQPRRFILSAGGKAELRRRGWRL